jgi:hypothetical protein
LVLIFSAVSTKNNKKINVTKTVAIHICAGLYDSVRTIIKTEITDPLFLLRGWEG